MTHITRFLLLYNPLYIGGEQFVSAQPRLWNQEDAQRIFNGKKNDSFHHQIISISWKNWDIEHKTSAPDGCVVRFVNILNPHSATPDAYTLAQTALYNTAPDAVKHAQRIMSQEFYQDYYIAVAVPVYISINPFSPVPFNSRFNYSGIHREELLFV